MVVMSAAIAELGLLQSSPAVVIGAMLISPLMGPIISLGFGLALFDFPSLGRSLAALAIAAVLAVAAGIAPQDLVIDRDGHLAQVAARPLAGATLVFEAAAN